MKTKLILLSLFFIGVSHNTSAGCGKNHLSITGKATLGYDYWQDPGPVTVPHPKLGFHPERFCF